MNGDAKDTFDLFTVKHTTGVLYPESCKFTFVSAHETEAEANAAMESATEPGRYIVLHPLGGYQTERFV